MKLGQKTFISGGTADSDRFLPDALYQTMVARPDQAGTVQLIFFDRYTDEELDQGSAVAGLADEDNAFIITYPIGGAYSGAILRYTNTDATPGTCTFSAGAAG